MIRRAPGTRTRGPAVALALLGLLHATTGPSAAQTADGASVTAFVGVNVVPMSEEGALPGQTVLVEDGRIARVGPADSVAVPDGARVIDGLNGYLMPGLIDLHAHLTDRYEFPLWLSYGVTRVQYLNALPDQLDLGRAVAAGEVAGPSLHFCAGPIGGIDEAGAARAEVARLAGLGFDCVKPYGDLSEAAFRALVDEADARGMRTIGHIPRNLTWQQVLAIGPTAIAHAEEFLYSPIESQADLDRIDSLMVANEIALIPATANYGTITEQPLFADRLLGNADASAYSPVDRRHWGSSRNHYVRSFPPERVPRMRALLGFQRRLVRRLADAGATIGLGTDAGNTMVFPGRSVHDELDDLARAGFEPAEALATATVNAAAILGLAGRTGVVAEGASADLVLVLGDPLADLGNARLVAGVMTRGEWMSRADLDAGLAESRRVFEPEERLIGILESQGLDAAIAWVDDAAASAAAPPVRLRALNELAYQLWRIDDDLEAAIRVFETNVRIHTDSWVSHASLAEAYEGAGRTAEALAAWRRAVELNPDYAEGRERIRALEG